MTTTEETAEVVSTELEEEIYPDEPEGGSLSPELLEAGTRVAGGGHVVPKGVAVEELKNYWGQKELQRKCPDEVRDLLTSKGALEIYEKFVDGVAQDRTTRSFPLGKWRDAQVLSVLDSFRDDFADHGIRVALCKRKSGGGFYRWLEFIDVDQWDTNVYVPQYDVANFSGQIIKTCHCRLEFPSGVAVEQFQKWGKRKKLKEIIPVQVEKMLQEHDLMQEYNQLIDHCIEAGCGAKFSTKAWNIEKLKEIVATYQPSFFEKGVDVFVSHKKEFITYGGQGGHHEHFRWIEFVDRAKQPNYSPLHVA